MKAMARPEEKSVTVNEFRSAMASKAKECSKASVRGTGGTNALGATVWSDGRINPRFDEA